MIHIYYPWSDDDAHHTTLVTTEENCSDECNEAEFAVSACFNLGRLYNYGGDMLRNRSSMLLPNHVKPCMPFAENLHVGEREIVQITQFGSLRRRGHFIHRRSECNTYRQHYSQCDRFHQSRRQNLWAITPQLDSGCSVLYQCLQGRFTRSRELWV